MAAVDITVDVCVQVCDTMKQIISKSYGPNALNNILTSSTGKVMITNSGMAVLQSLDLSHPIGRLIKDSISRYHQVTGDGSKTLLFALSESLHVVKKLTSDGALARKTISVACDEILHSVIPHVILPKILSLSEICEIDTQSEDFRSKCHDIIWTSLQGSFSKEIVTVLTDLLHGLIFSILNDQKDLTSKQICDLISYVINQFDLIATEGVGRPVQSSHVVKGIVLQRAFLPLARPSQPLENVNFILVAFSLEREESRIPSNTKMVVHTKEQLENALSWKVSAFSPLVDYLSSKNVKLIISTEHVGETMAFLCRQKGISVLQMVDQEEVERLAQTAGIFTVHTIQELYEQSNYGVTSMCKAVNLVGHEWVLLENVSAFVSVDSGLSSESHTQGHTRTTLLEGINDQSYASVSALQLVIYGPSSGLSSQYKIALFNSLKCVKMWLDSSTNLVQSRPCQETNINDRNVCKNEISKHYAYSIPAGGAFELTFSALLLHHAKTCGNTALMAACKILAESMQCPIHMLLKNSYASEFERILLLQVFQMSDHCSQLNGIDAKSGQGLLYNDHLVEPLSMKVEMVHHLISLLQVLLKLDSVVSIRKINTDKE